MICSDMDRIWNDLTCFDRTWGFLRDAARYDNLGYALIRFGAIWKDSDRFGRIRHDFDMDIPIGEIRIDCAGVARLIQLARDLADVARSV